MAAREITMITISDADCCVDDGNGAGRVSKEC
jgi:hypothetical protein